VAKLRKQDGRELFVIEDMKPSSDLKAVLWQVTQGVRNRRNAIADWEAAESRRRKFLVKSRRIGVIIMACLLLVFLLYLIWNTISPSSDVPAGVLAVLIIASWLPIVAIKNILDS